MFNELIIYNTLQVVSIKHSTTSLSLPLTSDQIFLTEIHLDSYYDKYASVTHS